MENSVLEVRDLKVHFRQSRRSPLSRPSTVHAVDGVSFSLSRGRTLGIVGESGSGKTTTALAAMRLLNISAGSVTLLGKDITASAGRELRTARRNIQMVFQDPFSSLNPRSRVGDIVAEALHLAGVQGASERQQRVEELFIQVGLRPDQLSLFPHQFSGGQRQRINIARAISSGPSVLVCDEPVSALDVAIQAQILNLLSKLQRDRGMAYLFISHDLGVVRYLCDDIAVMYLGQVVERGSCSSVFAQARHPYTQRLLAAVPKLHGSQARVTLDGDPPSPIDPPPGCRFTGRCAHVIARCHTEMPVLQEATAGHWVACHRMHEGLDSQGALAVEAGVIRRGL